MILIDNFLNQNEFDRFKKSIAAEAASTESIDTCEFREEFDHLGLDNSKFYYITGEARDILLQEFANRKICKPDVVENFNGMFRYHITKYPYYSVWHRDRLSSLEEEIDYIGITMFLNEWDSNNGGLFLYKEDNSDQGVFIEPKPNRVIINPEDKLHAVTQLTDTDSIRYSIQLFIHTKHMEDLNDLHRI